MTPNRFFVLIIQPVITDYRLRFYELLASRLLRDHIRLRVIYGTPHMAQAAKQDLADLPASIGSKVRNYWFFGGKVLYQPLLRQALSADLVIVLNANGYLLNYPLCLFAAAGCLKLGFWVWWKRKRDNSASIRERVRKYLTRAGCWWFAYTEGTKGYLLRDEIPEKQITVLNNSMDVSRFRSDLQTVTEEAVENFLKSLNIPKHAPIGLFCGGLYSEKRLDFLFGAVRLIQLILPNFHLLVIGDGLQLEVVKQAAAANAGIHYLGSLFGLEKALCFRSADIFLCPGLVGLAILDAFTAGLPLITTDNPLHSPEIEYLKPGVNGLITYDNLTVYADAVADLLSDAVALETLRQGAANSASLYSIEAMAEAFAEGIASCLNRK